MLPGHPIFPRDATPDSGPASGLGSPFRICGGAMHVHSIRAHSQPYLAARAYGPGAQPIPPSPDSEVAAPSHIIKRTSLTVIQAFPPPPRSVIAPSPSASSPARPKPQNHGPSPSPTSPIVGLAECLALPRGDRGGMPSPTTAYSRREKLVREREAGSRDFISNFFGILTTMARQTYYRG
jgi:hypothetical protein